MDRSRYIKIFTQRLLNLYTPDGLAARQSLGIVAKCVTEKLIPAAYKTISVMLEALLKVPRTLPCSGRGVQGRYYTQRRASLWMRDGWR